MDINQKILSNLIALDLVTIKKRQISDILSDQAKNVEAPCPAKSARATSVTSAIKDPPSATSGHDGVVDLLSDDIEFDSILQDLAAFEANQTNLQNNVNNMPNYLNYAAQSAGRLTINNSTIYFHFHK